jgi:putative membrane protein insertion efficiency factor
MKTDKAESAMVPAVSVSFVARAALALVFVYQKCISRPLHWVAGPYCGCRFLPTCSEYARQALWRYGFLRGGWLALRRLARCHPWNPGGVDEVP